jgi:hypothetical protein
MRLRQREAWSATARTNGLRRGEMSRHGRREMSADSTGSFLHGWPVCLALAEERLHQPAFRLAVDHSFDFTTIHAARRCRLKASAHRLRVKVLDTGLDLIQLVLDLEGELTIGERVLTLGGATWEIDTTFDVRAAGPTHEVVARLHDPDLGQRVVHPDLDTLDIAVLGRGLARWLAALPAERDFRLFSFDVPRNAPMMLDRFKVTTAYPEASSVAASFLLLMGNQSAHGSEEQPVFDPHVLPQGETAVLWVDRKTLDRTAGTGAAEDAERHLSQLQRSMKTDVPRVTPALQAWVRSLVDKVRLLVPLDFIAMQMTEQAMMLSATPMSEAQLDRLTSSDLTESGGSLVAAKAQELLSQCALYHLDDNYRKQLLGQDKPDLQPEVLKAVRDQGTWLRQFGRLQLARAIKLDPMGHDAPYDRLGLPAIERRLQELSRSPTCKTIIDRLYPLAFCLVRPRLALYLEDAKTWAGRYRDHLQSDAYADHLATLDNPAAQLHEDAAKLSLLEGRAEGAIDLLPDVTNRLLHRIAALRWKEVLRQRSADFRDRVEILLQPLLRRLPEASMAGATVPRVAQHWMAALDAEAQDDRPMPLPDVATRHAPSIPGLDSERGRAVLSLAAIAASLLVLLAQFPDVAVLEGGSSGLERFAEGLASEFERAWTTTVPLRTLVLNSLGPLVVGNVKLLRKGVEALVAWGKDAAAFSATTLGKAFACVGAALCLVSCALSIVDLVAAAKERNVPRIVVDAVSASVSVLAAVVFIVAPSGPLGFALMMIGLLLFAVNFLFFPLKTQLQKTAEAFTDALVADGAGA